MTVISTVINRRCIAVASDSLLTYKDENEDFVAIEKKKPKIVKVESKRAILSYWGYAATTAKMRGWTTYDFLKKIAKEAYQFESLESFANHIKERLTEDIGIKLEYSHEGIGIHLVGYMKEEDDYIPEFYLISNYEIKKESYKILPQIKVTSELYKSLPSDYKEWRHPTKENKRNAIMKFLNRGGTFIFNNGDPAMFNPFFWGYSQAHHIARQRGIMDDNEIERARFLAREPISSVVNAQKSLFRSDSKVVGGRVHDLTLSKTSFQYQSSPKSAKIE